MKPIKVKARKTGNSISVSLPKRILEEFEVKAGQVLDLVATKTRVTICKAKGARRK